MSNAALHLPELEQECRACMGSGVCVCDQGRVRCRQCDGAGFLPTEAGERVLALMRHNFGPLLQDARLESTDQAGSL
jgi:Tryptophan RNA-binding attenuator protein inhibitory protein